MGHFWAGTKALHGNVVRMVDAWKLLGSRICG